MAPAPPPPQQQAPAIGGDPDAGLSDDEEDPEEVEPWLSFSDSDSEPDEPDRTAPEPRVPVVSPASAVPDQWPAQAAMEEEEDDRGEEGEEEAGPTRWPGWPGASVFRLVVPADRVGGIIGRRGQIIGRRGQTIRRLCDGTRARARVLDAPHGAASRIVLVSATEEVEAELSPAMNAAIKIFKHINEIEEINSDGTLSASAPYICSVRLLVPTAQASHLIGKQGSTVNSIQETTGATIRIIDEGIYELLTCEAVNERIVEIRGATLDVLNALKLVLGLLRKFLVDHGVLHLFERKNQSVSRAHDTSKENQVVDDYSLPVNQDFLLSDSDQRSHGDIKDSRLLHGRDPSFCELQSNATDFLITQRNRGDPEDSRLFCGRDPSFHDPYSQDLSQPTDSFITQITERMQIPLPYAEEIIGARGQNIEFIRSASGAVVVLEEIRDYPGVVLVMIKGSPSQVQTANQLVQDVLSGNREPPSSSSYHHVDSDPRLLDFAHAGPRLMRSPQAAPRLLHSPSATATSRDYPPWHYEDQPPPDYWRCPSHHDFRGYRL